MENIPDSPEGIILESLLEGMNQYFSAELSQKVKRGMRESRNKGNYTGGPVPLGYKVIDKKLVVNEEEAAIVRHIFTEYTTGKYAKDIMDDLNARGIRNRGNLFVRSTMRNILANEKYKGIVRCNGEIYTNIYPQIVPNDTFDYVRDKLARNRYGFHNAPRKTHLWQMWKDNAIIIWHGEVGRGFEILSLLWKNNKVWEYSL